MQVAAAAMEAIDGEAAMLFPQGEVELGSMVSASVLMVCLPLSL